MHELGFRKILPILFGSVAVALMIWDYHNQRVIESMGMAWDVGAPIWPYQTSWISLFAINAPAYFVSAPIFYLLNLQTAYSRYPLQFLLILLLWWWVGSRVDNGLLAHREYRRRGLIGLLLSTTAVVLLCLAAGNAVHATRLWLYRGRPLLDSISLLTAFGPLAWCIVFGFCAAQATVRLVRGNCGANTGISPRQGIFRRAIILLLLIIIAIVIGITVEHKVLQP